MSKRSRGVRRPPSRPGTRAPKSRPSRPGAPRPSRLEAAEDVAEAVVEGRLATAAEGLEQAGAADVRRTRGAAMRPRSRPSAVLAARAAEEYIYVAQDIRRIAVVAALMFGVLLVTWALSVADILPI